MLNVILTSKPQDQSKWEGLVSSIDEGLGAAKLQDAFNPFGEEAGDALQDLLDETEDMYWHLVFGQVNDHQVTLEFDGPIFSPDCTERL